MPTPSMQNQIESAIQRRGWIRADGWRSTDMLSFMRDESIPGASVAVIDQGQVAWAQHYGVKRAGAADPVTLETRFQAASISKVVAALAALSLVQAGKLGLDEDIRGYQTTWRIPAHNGWQPRVTLRQLLSHSGGVTVDGFPGYSHGAPIPSLRQVLDGESPANTPPILVDTLPGLHFRYSGGGFTILQQLLEDVTGQPFWQVAEERVLQPLGMTHTTYQFPLGKAWAADCAHGHRADGQPISGGWHTYPESAAAGMWTTPLDLAQMLLEIEATLRGEGGRVISRALMEEMTKPQIRLRGIGLAGWEGLSLFLSEEEDGWYCGHGGSNEGYRAQFIIRKGRGQAAVIMTNADSGDALTDPWMETVALTYGWTGFAYHPPRETALDDAQAELLSGRYQAEDGRLFEVIHTEEGLSLVAFNQPPLTLLARKEHHFFTSQINAEVLFSVEQGICSVLTFKQNGESLTARRVEED